MDKFPVRLRIPHNIKKFSLKAYKSRLYCDFKGLNFADTAIALAKAVKVAPSVERNSDG